MKKISVFRGLGMIIPVVASCMVVSCMPEDDFQDIEILAPSPSLSLPILNTSLQVSDLIRTEQGGLLEEKPDGSYSLFYRKSIQTQPVGDFFPPIPEQQYQEAFSVGISAPSFFLSDAVTYEGSVPLDLEGLTIYGIECKQGNLNVSLSSDYDHDINVVLTLNDVLDNDGNPLVMEFDLPSWGARNASVFTDLSGYLIDINNNELNYTAQVSISGTGQPIDASDQLTFDLNIADLDFSYLEGNFSGLTVPVDADTLDIPVLASAINGDVALNPSLKVDIQNSFGVPITPDLSNVYVRRKSGTVVRLQDEGESNFFSGEFEFPYLKDRNELPAFKSQEVNRLNSNIEEAFAELPRGLAYIFGFNLSSGPDDVSFVTENSSIGIDMEVELPLEGSFDIMLEDTLAMDLGTEQDIDALKVLIKTENGFPIDANLQVFFLDSEGEMIYGSDNEPLKLFEEQAQLLKAAQIINSTTGETQSVSTDMPISATMDAEKVQMIQNAGSILVQARLQSKSEDNGMIKLYSSYGIRFSLAMQIKSSLNVSN